MAAFTSVTDGNWNDGATWGNSSPGSKGTDWPGAAGDTFTVDTGDTVTYNVSETNELGDSTINGTLTFVTNASTKLTFGNNTLTIGATGTLNVGSSGTPVGAAYTAEIIFNTTSDNTDGISVTNGGQYKIYGDPDYVSDFDTTLANDAENTDGDAWIKTNDDMSAIWNVGDEITFQIEDNGDSTSHTDAIRMGVIQSFSGTSIELDINVTCDTGVGNTWTSPVKMVTRNVKIYKYGAVTDMSSASRWNTNRPYFNDNTTGANTNVLSDVQITGLYRIILDNGNVNNCVIRNGYYGFNYSDGNTISGNIYGLRFCFMTCLNNTISSDIYACEYGLRFSNNNNQSGAIYACLYGLSDAHRNTIDGDIYTCFYGIIDSGYNIINGDIYACQYGINYAFGTEINGSLGYNGALSRPNTTYDVSDSNLIANNLKMPLAGLDMGGKNGVGGTCTVISGHDDETLNAHKTYQVMGDTIKTPCDGSGTSPSQDPDAGSDDCIEVSNLQSNINTYQAVFVFNPFEYAIYAQASTSKTYTFKVQSTFTATLANTEVWLEGKYMNGSDGALTLIKSTGTVATRSSASDWAKTLAVTINPNNTGFVYFQIKLAKYESGKKLYVWPEVAIT